MVPVTTLLTTANYYISNVSIANKNENPVDLYTAIFDYVNSYSFANENKISKRIENEINNNQNLNLEQIQVWTKIVNDLRRSEDIVKDDYPQTAQKIRNILNVIKKNLKVKIDQAINNSDPERVDLSKFDYYTREIAKVEQQYRNSPDKALMVEKKLAEAAVDYSWRGGFPKDLKYEDWVRYKKNLAYFGDKRSLAEDIAITNTLNKIYLHMFVNKQNFVHPHTYSFIQSFFMNNLDCDDIASFAYVVLLANGVPANKLNLVGVSREEQKNDHMVLCFELAGDYYVFDNKCFVKGSSYRDALEILYNRMLPGAVFSIVDPTAHLEYIYDENNYIKRSNIKINEIDKALNN